MHTKAVISASIGLLAAALLPASAIAASAAAAAGPPTGEARLSAAPAPSGGTTAFRSGIERYRPWRADEPLRDWREANDEAARLGGHVGHVGHTAAPAAAGAPPHGGH